jgi:hypothetical protein
MPRAVSSASDDASQVRLAIEKLLANNASDLHQCNHYFRPQQAQIDPFTPHVALTDVDLPATSTSHAIAQSLVHSNSESTADNCYNSMCKLLQVQHMKDLRTPDIIQRAMDESTMLEPLLEQMILSSELDYVRISKTEFAVQKALSSTFLKVFCHLSNGEGIDNLSRICSSVLDNDAIVLRVLLIYTSPSEFLRPLCSIFDNAELMNTIDDTSILGSIILLCQHVIKHGLRAGAHLEDLVTRQDCPFMATFFRSVTAVPTTASPTISGEEELIASWITALFGSEGIPDELTRSSPPQLLLRITPTIFSQTAQALSIDLIDLDIVKGGMSYFLQDLLIYTLPTAIYCLLDIIERASTVKLALYSALEVEMAEKKRAFCVELVAGLLTADGCPMSVKSLVVDRARRTLSDISMSPTAATIIDDLKSAHFPSHTVLSVESLAKLASTIDSAVSPALSRSLLTLYDCVAARIQIDIHSLKAGSLDVDKADDSMKQRQSAIILAIFFGCWRQMRGHKAVATGRKAGSDAFAFMVHLDGLLASFDEESRELIEQTLSTLLESSSRALSSLRGSEVVAPGRTPELDSFSSLSYILYTISSFKRKTRS